MSGMKVFAAIDVGSYELAMKVFTISRSGGMKEVDHVRHRIEIGTDTYMTGKISKAHMDELCEVLLDFKKIMGTYKVDDYRAYGTSALRESENMTIILEQIRNRTGIEINVISNSEQRFLNYKAVASKGADFDRIIEKSTAIVDIGGGSMQISIFNKDSLVTTQNLKLGVLRLRGRLRKLQAGSLHFEELVEEMVNNQFMIFKKMFLKDKTIKNIIVVDDYVSNLLCGQKLSGTKGYADQETYHAFVDNMIHKNMSVASRELGISEENAVLTFYSAILVKRIMQVLGSEMLWSPGVTLCDGMAYEYASENELMTLPHDFEKDILACADDISRRYQSQRKRIMALEGISLTIFDSMQSVHGLSQRERLLLRIAVRLYDCGKYISLTRVGECSYSIIMATEIIGLSHVEREIVANVVKYNRVEFDYYEELGRETTLDRMSYLTIAKLTAILRVANGLDRSHKQKFKDVKVTLSEGKMVLTVDTDADITLEKGLLDTRAKFFEEVFSVTPVIRQKKSL